MRSASRISAAGAAPKLKVSRATFTGKQESITEAVVSNTQALSETNLILVEIQKQLSLDFAMRIAEERETIKRMKAAESRRRFGAEERAVEGTKKIGKGIGKTFNKVISPAKGIFDRIIDFFSIILTGVVFNKAFNWLKDKNNRERVSGVVSWVTKHWKELLTVFIGVKVFGFISKLLRFGRLISGAFGFFGRRGGRLLRRFGFRGRGPGGTGPGGGPKKPKGPKGGGGGGILGGFLNLLINNWDLLLLFVPIPGARLVAAALRGLRVANFATKLAKMPRIIQMAAKLFGRGANVLAKPAKRYNPASYLGRVGTRASGSGAARKTIKPGVKTDIGQYSATERKAWAIEIGKRAKQFKNDPSLMTKEQMMKIYEGKDPFFQSLLDRAAARSVLTQKSGFNIPKSKLPEVAPGFNPLSGQKITAPQEGIMTFASGRRFGGPVSGGTSSRVDDININVAKDEYIVSNMEGQAVRFRPFLDMINYGGGKVWTAFSKGVRELLLTSQRQEKTEKVLEESVSKLSQSIRTEKAKKALTNSGGGSRASSFNVKPKASPTPSYYSMGRSAGGGMTFLPMVLPTKQPKLPTIPTPQAPATEVAFISPMNVADPYRQLTPEIYGIFV